MSIEVTEITIKINEETELGLTVDEARQLYVALGELFGEKPQTYPITNPIMPAPMPYFDKFPEITCNAHE